MARFTAWRALVAASIPIVALTVVTGCAAGGESTPEPAETSGGTLTLVATSAPDGVDPATLVTSATNPWFVALAYDSLLDVNEEGEIVGRLATEWGYSSDGLSFTLTLRDDATFVDGTPVDAAAVAASLDYWRAGPNGERFASAIDTIQATDEDTVEIALSTPDPALPTLFTPQWMGGAIVSPAGLEDQEALATGTFGSGPYQLDPSATITNDTYVYTATPDYWDPERQHYDEVVVRIVADQNSALQTVQAGQADLTVGDFTVAPTAETSGLQIVTTPSRFIGVNLTDRNGEVVPAMADVKVRQALNLAIDREAIASSLFGEYGEANWQLTTPSQLGFDDSLDGYYAYDPEAARDLLAEAGYEDGFSIKVNTINTFGIDLMTQAVLEYWNEIGVTSELRTVSTPPEWTQDALTKQFGATGLSATGSPMSMQLPQFFFAGATLQNPFDYQDPEMAALYEELTATTTPEQTAEVGTRIQEYMLEQAYFAVVLTVDTMFFHREGMSGVVLNDRVAFLDPTKIAG